jgi:leucine-rich PPR motif-containing protein
LETLTEEIENAKDNDFELLAEKFPRGGAIGILEKHPELQPECKLQHSLSAASTATQTGFTLYQLITAESSEYFIFPSLDHHISRKSLQP